MSNAIWGKAPAGARLARLQQSPHYKDGQFQNISATPQLAEGYSMAGVIYSQLFRKEPRRRPSCLLPVVKIDLKSLDPARNVLVWFGHSSYYLQLEGRRFLIDPVLSGNASPVRGTTKAFSGTDPYDVDDLPQIDFLLISHDHYDHLDYHTVAALRDRVGRVACGLGVGAHLEHWGYEAGRITELDWYETANLAPGMTLHATPARHFSGRTLRRNNTLWVSFVLQTAAHNLYLGGDSGYDRHFAEIGDRYGPFDLAILENGQYNEAWHYIHMLPPEVLQAARDLKAERLLPVHSCKFALANHAWDEPLATLSRLNGPVGIPLLTPRIGEPVWLDDAGQVFTPWWEAVPDRVA